MEHTGACEHGDVIRAIRQTAGRGRFRRQWISPEDSSLTLSVILKQEILEEHVIPIIGQVAALAVAATLEKHNLKALLKWPNDVLVDGKKVAGILAEADTGTGKLVLGIGLNVNLTPADLSRVRTRQPATSMSIEANRGFDLDTVCLRLLSNLGRSINDATRDGASGPARAWECHDFLKGKVIEVRTGSAVLRGKYLGMDGKGRLRLKVSTGKEHRFWTGDVSLTAVP